MGDITERNITVTDAPISKGDEVVSTANHECFEVTAVKSGAFGTQYDVKSLESGRERKNVSSSAITRARYCRLKSADKTKRYIRWEGEKPNLVPIVWDNNKTYQDAVNLRLYNNKDPAIQ